MKSSKSESDFSIELPRSFNVPDGVVARIDDIDLPVSWSTIDERNRKCYVAFSVLGAVRESNFAFDTKNYDGFTFATAWQRNLVLQLLVLQLCLLSVALTTTEKTN